MRFLLLSIPWLLACGAGAGASTTAWTASPSGMKGVSSGASVERYFPLVDGQIYQYATSNELNDRGLLIARVFRSDPAHGELRYPSGKVKRFEYGPDGVKLMPAGAFILRAPLDPSATWRGENGGQTSVLAMNATVEVPAGTFTGCVQTLEERRGDRPVRFATTFCPDVGIVLLEAASGASLERAELKSYAAALEMKPDGVDRTGGPGSSAPAAEGARP